MASGASISNEAEAAADPPKLRRNLAAFDFNQTVVLYNADVAVRDFLPRERTKYDPRTMWIDYMANIFRLLHMNGVSPQRIKDTVRALPEVPGFIRLIKQLKSVHNMDLIIISDSNSVFINEWLQEHGLSNFFEKIYANPAYIRTDSFIYIAPYFFPYQTDCELSAPNFCKGRILESHMFQWDILRNIIYDHVIYIGNGLNDVCPVKRLRALDAACVRRGFALERSVIAHRDLVDLSAELIVWENGFDLLDQIEGLLEQYNRQRNEEP